MKSLLPEIGKAIRILREKRGLSQTDVREKTGLEASYISRIETGKIRLPRVDTINKIAIAIDTTVDEIVKLAIKLETEMKK